MSFDHVHGLRGSSPLARGLQVIFWRVRRCRGIIPARAGFTDGRRRARGRRWDHPRSRGVYGEAVAELVGAAGSSPLARGLPFSADSVVPRARIIPARAGFTAWKYNPPGSLWDHPRSRGVYFTGGVRYFDGCKDHPRSRGVYAPHLGDQVGDLGSSPLARGLLHNFWRLRTGPGIIPARAGFTRRHSAQCRPAGDHPRSRGVYPDPFWHYDGGVGSSPLARGLPPAAPSSGGIPRIIPARAGFTLRARHSRLRPRDHPRSRGVYPTLGGSGGGGIGSSPLARGLQTQAAVTRMEKRIIPACHPHGEADHPRSRGVYWLGMRGAST